MQLISSQISLCWPSWPHPTCSVQNIPHLYALSPTSALLVQHHYELWCQGWSLNAISTLSFHPC